MPVTHPSLLEQLRDHPDDRAWQRLTDLYSGWIKNWLLRQGLKDQDADDLLQNVLLALVRELPNFHYDPSRGSFRGWLRTITANRLRAFWRDRRRHPDAEGGSDFAQRLIQLEDPNSGLSREFEREHDRHVVARLLELIRPEFEPLTWQAFHGLDVEGKTGAQVAAELGLSRNAVYIAKSHVRKRLREEMKGLID